MTKDHSYKLPRHTTFPTETLIHILLNNNKTFIGIDEQPNNRPCVLVDPDLASHLEVLDRNEELIHVEHPTKENGLEHAQVWDIKAWKDRESILMSGHTKHADIADYVWFPTKMLFNIILNARGDLIKLEEDPFNKDYISVSAKMGRFLKHLDANEVFIHVEFPDEYNGAVYPKVWEKGAWRSGETKRNRLRAEQTELQRLAGVKRELTDKLTTSIYDMSGYRMLEAEVLARQYINSYNIALCGAYGVDITVLPKDYVLRTKVV